MKLGVAIQSFERHPHARCGIDTPLDRMCRWAKAGGKVVCVSLDPKVEGGITVRLESSPIFSREESR